MTNRFLVDTHVGLWLQSDRRRVDGLPVTHVHALQVAAPPHHHSDPFDRLLVAQARLEELTLVTVDPRIELYDVTTLWADAARCS